MSTRCTIAIKNKIGTIHSIYCHSDGYPTWTGKYLLQFYNDDQKVRDLIKLGNLSILHPKLIPNPNQPHTFNDPQDGVTVAYGRDRGEKNQQPKLWRDLKEFMSECNFDYTYLFDTYDEMWYFREYDSRTLLSLTPVDCGLEKSDDIVIKTVPKPTEDIHDRTPTPMAKRKVVQLTIPPTQDGCLEAMYALCDDGTIWMRLTRANDGWCLFQDVPQPGQDKEEFENRV